MSPTSDGRRRSRIGSAADLGSGGDHREPINGDSRGPRPRLSGVAQALLCVALAIPSAGTSYARAQQGPNPQMTNGDGRALFQRGVTALREGRHGDAAAAFEQCHAATGSVAAMCNLAIAYERWGEHVQAAIDAYDRCAAQDWGGRYHEHAAERAVALRAQLGGPTGNAVNGPADPLPVGGGNGAPNPFVAMVPPAAGPGVPAAPPIDQPGDDDGGRSHPLLWTGVGVAGLALVAGIGGAWAMSGAQDEADALDRALMGGRTIAAGSPAHDRYLEAKADRDLGVGLYVASGALAGLAGLLIAIDLAVPAPAPNADRSDRREDATADGRTIRGGTSTSAALRLGLSATPTAIATTVALAWR